ncbi:glycosyltransferase family 4 protein [Candidatus Micrarchaeota archaeon]|nr:glycosyltransferase family 4 protein [Candidatus Micrarchaeota archaeon]
MQDEHLSIFSVSQSFLPYIGGLARYVDALGKQFVKRGHQFQVAHFKTPQTDVIDFSGGIEIIRINVPKLGDETLSKYMQFKELVLKITHAEKTDDTSGYEEYLEVNAKIAADVADAYKYKPFDILNVHDFQTLPIGGMLKDAYGINVPMVFTWHVPFIAEIPQFWKDFFIKNMDRYDRVIFSIPEYSEAAIKCGLRADKICTLPPFLDTEGYLPQEPNKERAKYSIAQNDFLVACVSRMDPRKGQEILIDALDIIINKEKRTTVKCLFVGNGSFSKELLKKERSARVQILMDTVEAKGLQNNIFFTGKVEDSELYSVYQDCDVAVQPSLHEGFGLTVTEAMVFGKPVIGSNVGGIPIQIEDGVNGYLFEKGNVRELAQKLMNAMDEPQRRKEMGEKGKETVKNKFSSEMGYEQYIRIYREILQKRNPQPEQTEGT